MNKNGFFAPVVRGYGVPDVDWRPCSEWGSKSFAAINKSGKDPGKEFSAYQQSVLFQGSSGWGSTLHEIDAREMDDGGKNIFILSFGCFPFLEFLIIICKCF